MRFDANLRARTEAGTAAAAAVPTQRAAKCNSPGSLVPWVASRKAAIRIGSEDAGHHQACAEAADQGWRPTICGPRAKRVAQGNGERDKREPGQDVVCPLGLAEVPILQQAPIVAGEVEAVSGQPPAHSRRRRGRKPCEHAPPKERPGDVAWRPSIAVGANHSKDCWFNTPVVFNDPPLGHCPGRVGAVAGWLPADGTGLRPDDWVRSPHPDHLLRLAGADRPRGVRSGHAAELMRPQSDAFTACRRQKVPHEPRDCRAWTGWFTQWGLQTALVGGAG